MPAGIALLEVTAQRRRAAGLDGAHDTALPAAERVSVILTVSWPELAKDIRYLEPGGAQRAPQKCAGGLALGCGGSTLGNRSNGLTVAHSVLVAIFR